jgi:hypothetical protein
MIVDDLVSSLAKKEIELCIILSAKVVEDWLARKICTSRGIPFTSFHHLYYLNRNTTDQSDPSDPGTVF